MLNKILQNIFSVKNDNIHKVWTILGIKIKFKNQLNFLKFQVMSLTADNQALNKTNKFLVDNNNNINEQNVNLINEIKIMQNQLQHAIYLDFTYIDHWKKYYNKNYFKIENLLNILKNNMDEKSQEIVDLIFERNMILAYYEKHRNVVKYDPFQVFRKWEFEAFEKQQNQIKEYFAKVNDLNKYNDLYQEKHLFVTDNGLKSLPLAVQKYITNKDIIDGGAWVGDSALIFEKYNPRQIHSFEPIKANYERLLEIISTKNLTSLVTPVCAGLGERNKNEICCQRTSGSTFLTDCFDDLPKEEISIIDIDTYVKNKNLKIGLIKLDVEGYEFATIKGALNTIKNDRPILLISIYHLPKDFFEIKPLIENEVGGYIFKIEKLMQLSPTIDTILVGYPEELIKK